MLTMTLDHYQQSEIFTLILDYLNMIFICIFSTECLMKIFALRYHYFVEPWNLFDVVVVVLSILSTYDMIYFQTIYWYSSANKILTKPFIFFFSIFIKNIQKYKKKLLKKSSTKLTTTKNYWHKNYIATVYTTQHKPNQTLINHHEKKICFSTANV